LIIWPPTLIGTLIAPSSPRILVVMGDGPRHHMGMSTLVNSEKSVAGPSTTPALTPAIFMVLVMTPPQQA